MSFKQRMQKLKQQIIYIKRKISKDKTPIEKYFEIAKKSFPVEIKVYEEENS